MRYLYFLAVLLFTSAISSAQVTTGSSGTGANINVDNYQIWWRINPDSSKGIKGVVMVKFKTTVANVSVITLDLSSLMTLDAVTFRGTSKLAFSSISASNILTINLGTTIPTVGMRDSVIIAYHGIPQNQNGPGGGRLGFNKTTDFSGGNTVYTLAESYEDRDWWPCKADMQDKADTVDITVNVPWRTNNATAASATDTFWVATNGLLVDSTIDLLGTQAQRNRTFTFLNRYPMASYLVCVSVGRYSRYYRNTYPIGGFNVPVVYYINAGRSTAQYNTILANWDAMTNLTNLFAAKYGNYGFIDPVRGGKTGFYEGLGTFGGMEHQSFSGISTNSVANKSILAHELSHQWFGDKVTMATWNHLWLAEGFASYSEALAAELTPMGYTAYSSRSATKSAALSEGTSVYIPNANMTSSDLIWGNTTGSGYQNSIYDRGGMVVSMLRTLAGDAKFFQALQEYQTDPALEYKSAVTNDVKNHFNTVLGLTGPNDLTEFFNDYVMGTGNPKTNIGYQTFGTGSKSLALSVISQTQVASSVSYFNGPVVVHVQHKTGTIVNNDTTIVIYDWGGGNLSKAGLATGLGPITPGNALTYNLSFVANTFFNDDSARTLSQSGTFTALSIVDLKILDFNVRQHNTYNDASLLLDDNSIHSDVTLERSADGGKFEDLGTMVLQASATSSKKYIYNDMSPLKGDSYYRAKYKNIDGVFIYSKIVKLGNTKTAGYIILSNPVHELLQIKTAEVAGKNIVFSIIDVTGKQIISKQVSNAGNITDINLPAGITPGVYVVKIAAEGEEAQNLKFIVK